MKKTLLGAVILMGILISGLNAESIEWPLKNKDVSDVSIFFDHDDAVDTISRSCSDNRFPKHLGIDIRTYVGADVYPAYSGKVEYINHDMNNGWGKFLVLSHSNNQWTSVYWHLSSINVTLGEDVDKSDIIGNVHDTSHLGDVPHLHFGIRLGEYVEASKKGIGDCDNLLGFLNPLDFLPSKSFMLIDDEQVPHRGVWNKSTSVDFYTNKGYSATNTKSSYALYPYKFPSDGEYNVYERSTKANDRRSDAAFILYVNEEYVKHVFMDQTEIDDKGKSRFLFSYNEKKDDVLVVIPYNHKDDGDWLISDAILFKKN